MSDEEKRIIEAAKAGEDGAFEQLFHHFYSMAYAMAFAYTKNDADAKDAVQESFLSIHDAIKELREINTFPAWLKTIVHSKCYKIFRKKHDIPADIDTFYKNPDQEYRSYMDPMMSADYHNEQEVLRQLIGKLKPRYQEVIELVYLKQMKLEEAAQQIGLSVGTVKTRIHRAKKDLAYQVELFEKENGRKITFHGDVLASTSLLSVLVAQIKAHYGKGKQLITSNGLTCACGLSMSVLMIAGGVMRYDDLHQEKQALTTAPITTLTQEEERGDLRVPRQARADFIPVAYQDDMVNHSRSAYFVCMNFALDENDMKQHTTQEINEIMPIYKALKQRGDEYYLKLVKDGWEQWLLQEYQAELK